MTSYEHARQRVERALGYRFRDPELFRRAMTSVAYAHEQAQKGRHHTGDWKNLEWLGDAVVYLAATIFRLGEEEDRKTRTPSRADLVSNQALAELGRGLGLADALILTDGDRNNITQDGDEKYLAQSTEALFGAVFHDLRVQALPAWDYVEGLIQMHHENRPPTAWVIGTPVPGESKGEAAWRAEVQAGTEGLGPGPSVLDLHIVVAPSSKGDLDNLVRPVLDGLRHAGWYSRGFPTLDRLLARRSRLPCVGVIIRGNARAPFLREPQLDASIDDLPPTDSTKGWIERWKAEIERAAPTRPDGEVAVHIEVRAERSLKDLMKPILDGLEPWLGRDPSARSTFAPNDDVIAELLIERTTDGPAVRLRGGVAG